MKNQLHFIFYTYFFSVINFIINIIFTFKDIYSHVTDEIVSHV